MADARANLILAAQDTTSAAFNSTNSRLRALQSDAGRASANVSGSFRQMGTAVLSVRNVLAGFGVALSAQALGKWAADAIRSADATYEQRAALNEAAAALTRLNTNAQALAVTVASHLAPAIADAAEYWRRFLFPTASEAADDRLTEMSEKALKLSRTLNELVDKGAVSRDSPGVARVRAEIEALQRQMFEARGERDKLLGAVPDPNRGDFFGGGAPDSSQLDFQNRVREQQQRAIEEAARARDREHSEAAEHAARVAEIAARQAEEQRERETRETERRREQLAQRFADLQLSMMTELEYERSMFEQRQALLDEALANRLLSEQQYAEMSAQNEEELAERKRQIAQREASLDKQLRLQKLAGAYAIISGLTAIAAVGANESKKNFERHKKLATAEAIIATYQAVATALANPPGPPFSIPQAVAAGLFGFAQVKAIQATTWSGGSAGSVGGFGAGGGGGSGGFGGFSSERLPTLPERTEARAQTIIQVDVHGSVIGEGGRAALAEEIAELVREHLSERDGVVIDFNSRQAAMIRGDA